jgi:APA family basic amino acid/polyamine antiporter
MSHSELHPLAPEPRPGNGPAATAAAVARADLRRDIGLWGALAIMVGIMIGNGIFRAPIEIAPKLGSPWLILALWVVGGLISLCGALTYAELATMYPQSGGVYVFLREGLGRGVAFVFGWTYMLITKPYAAAGIAVVFGEHVNALFRVHWDYRITTCAMLFLLTVINTVHVRVGSSVAVFLTALKVLALVAIAALGFTLGVGSPAHFASVPTEVSLLAALTPVMAAILWAYDGWSDVGAIAGEVRNPQRRLPRIYLLGTAAITGLYVAVIAAYLWVVPLGDMRKIHPDTGIAPEVTTRLLGAAAATGVTLVVLISTFGSTHGSIITGARVTYAQARDGLLFRFLGVVSPRWGTPIVSLWVQLLLSCLATIFVANWSDLIGGFTFTMWIFYALAAVSIFILRRRRPDLVRPYRCWGYPVIPLLFIAAAAFMTVLALWNDLSSPATRGVKTLPWLGVLLAGWPVYLVWRRVAGRVPAASA